MQIIKEQILLNNLDSSLKVTLYNNTKEYGIYKEVTDLLKDEEIKSINKPVDFEKRRFDYSKQFPRNIYFHFGVEDSTSILYVRWIDAGFSDDDILYEKPPFKNSFFIFDIFDTYDFKTQKKISTSYITKLNNTPVFYLGLSNLEITQISNIYIPEYYLNDSTKKDILYCRFSFFNAKTGKITTFLNNNYNSIITSEKMFGKIRINNTDKTWEFLDFDDNIIVFKELLNNEEYSNKIDNTLIKKNDIKQQYPSNDDNKFITFDYKTGKYF